jgi:tRNA(Ile)-lysidine synthase
LVSSVFNTIPFISGYIFGNLSYKIDKMLDRFRSFIRENHLIRKSDKILLTVSGGIDSVVMLDLFIKAGYSCGIAHCNFGLRGTESDEDEDFVRQLAYQYSVRFFYKRFNTEEYAEDQSISIQMAARKLRYDWFEKIRKELSFELIATAHNQDDVLETFFINLSRGSGIRGLTGIKVISGRIIRPMLFAPRSMIEAYANEYSIPYREDSSNASDKYIRNKIRHKILPFFEEINPSFRSVLMETIQKLRDAESIYTDEINLKRNEIVTEKDEILIIALDKLRDLPQHRTYLFEFLSEYHFTPKQIADIDESVNAPSGKQFFSTTHRLVKDRSRMIITPIGDEEYRKYYIPEGTGQIIEPVHLEFIVIENTPGFRIPSESNIACLDYDLLSFPLLIRKWQNGDYFRPLGMKHRKKLSDFLVDQKISIVDKENLWLLLNNEDIVWVINQRIDERYKISSHTKLILMIKSFTPSSY